MKTANIVYQVGHINANEEIREAAKREAKEEIGINIDIKDMEFYKVLNRKVNDNQEYIDFIFKTQNWTGNITNEEQDKCEKIIWVNKDEIPKNTLDFIPNLFEKSSSNYLPYNWEV